MAAQELVTLALRVLSAWNKGRAADAGDVAVLRQQCSPEWPTDIEIDELACLVIKRETDRVLAESQAARKGIKTELPDDLEDKIA